MNMKKTVIANSAVYPVALCIAFFIVYECGENLKLIIRIGVASIFIFALCVVLNRYVLNLVEGRIGQKIYDAENFIDNIKFFSSNKIDVLLVSVYFMLPLSLSFVYAVLLSAIYVKFI